MEPVTSKHTHHRPPQSFNAVLKEIVALQHDYKELVARRKTRKLVVEPRPPNDASPSGCFAGGRDIGALRDRLRVLRTRLFAFRHAAPHKAHLAPPADNP